MAIKPAEVEAVRVALSDHSITPLVVAKTYTPRVSMLLAVTILGAVKKTTFAPREYGKLLRTLIVEVAEPEEGWPHKKDGAIIPEWYQAKRKYQFVYSSRQAHLHKSGDRAGNNLILTLPAELLKLLESPSRQEKAQDWYNVALEKARRKEALARQKALVSSKCRAIQREFADVYWELIMNGIRSEQQARLILVRLTAIVDRHFPSQRR